MSNYLEGDYAPLDDLEDLRLNKHTATMEYLTDLYHHIANNKSRTTITRLEIAKVLITGPKAQLLADTLSHPNCAIRDLVINRCRAKSEKMGLIFCALARN